MSARIAEYHGDEAKVLTTDEVERWQQFLGDGIQLRRTLATTRALETARDDNIELRCQLVDATSVATKLARERDELRAALQRAFRWVPDDMMKEMETERALAFGKDSDDE